MELPRLQKPDRYVGLYIVDFGDHCGVGFLAEEVAELLESERYSDVKVYKIHRASPDGTLELIGVPAGRFQLEMGMFFYASGSDQAAEDFKRLTCLAVKTAPPCRAKVHLAQLSDNRYLTALIYPAEYDPEVSSWLLSNDFRTPGLTEGGLDALQQYYDSDPEILDRHQLFGRLDHDIRTGQELLENLKVGIQR